MKLDVGGYGESVLGVGGGGVGGSGGCVAVQDIDRLPCPSLTCPISHHDGKVRVGNWNQPLAANCCSGWLRHLRHVKNFVVYDTNYVNTAQIMYDLCSVAEYEN